MLLRDDLLVTYMRDWMFSSIWDSSPSTSAGRRVFCSTVRQGSNALV